MAIQNLRSSTANKRPDPLVLVEGQLAINYESSSPSLCFRDSSDNLVKVGPVHVGVTAPNSSPAGSAGNAVGEIWLDTGTTPNATRVWDGSAWQSLMSSTGDSIVIGTSRTPSSATDTGVQGEICWDANYIYVCTATNTWKRVALSTW
jgi:hypothetical protein|tara:strand:+ start:7224 stop:7667 length:444 start_codon:yes stop_codon:yes gene_type:complete